jgi:hypothetical protein
MAHFAQLDENNRVLRVLVIEQAEIDTGNWGDPTHWKQCSYNTRGGVHYTNGQPSEDQTKALRKNFPSIGYIYDAAQDAFYSPSPPYPSWVLNNTTYMWEAPIPQPPSVNGEYFTWDETNRNWVVVEQAQHSNQILRVTVL